MENSLVHVPDEHDTNHDIRDMPLATGKLSEINLLLYLENKKYQFNLLFVCRKVLLKIRIFNLLSSITGGLENLLLSKNITELKEDCFHVVFKSSGYIVKCFKRFKN